MSAPVRMVSVAVVAVDVETKFSVVLSLKSPTKEPGSPAGRALRPVPEAPNWKGGTGPGGAAGKAGSVKDAVEGSPCSSPPRGDVSRKL